MGRTLESLKVFRKAIRKYEDTIRHYKGLFISDGRIDSEEQALLDDIQNMILLVEKEIAKREAKLSDREKNINKTNEINEEEEDLLSNTDDFIIENLMAEESLESFKSSKLDGLHVKVHSAEWTDKLLDWLINNPSTSVYCWLCVHTWR